MVPVEMENKEAQPPVHDHDIDLGHDLENPKTPLLAALSRKATCWLPLSSDPCIYIAPKQLVIKNKSAYTPKVVSIGPIHHGGEGLQLMEEYKQRFFGDFLERTKDQIQLENYLEFMKKQESRLRGSYAHTIEYGSEELLEIVAVDAAFVLELLLKNYVKDYEKSCRIFDRPHLIMNIVSDLILLENQLPMFLLKELFDFARIKFVDESGNFEVSVVQLVCEFINLRSDIGVDNYDLEKVLTSEPKHFLDCLRLCHLSSIETSVTIRKRKNLWIPTVTQLRQAGVQFRKSLSKHLLDIKFKNGVLEIPHIFMGNSTEIIYRNLLAFEQCHYIHESYFTHYFSFMDQLIDSGKDIGLLVDKGIVQNVLGDNEQAANVINNLAQGLAISDKFYFADIGDRLAAYYKKPWNKQIAILKQNYFNTPWAVLSIIIAGIFLLLTLIQAVFSVPSFSHS